MQALSICGALAAALCLSFPVAASANEGESSETDNHFALGVGVLFQQAPFKGSETKAFPLPLISLKQDILYIEAAEAGIELDTELGGIVPSIQGFVAARATTGTDREKVTADVGLRLSMKSALGVLSAEHRMDITGKFDGEESILRFSHPIPLGKLSITPAAQVSFLDREAANYMYGVTAAQRAKMIAKNRKTILPVYEITDNATNWGGDLSATLGISDRLTLLGTLSGTHLDKTIRLNPGIDKKWECQAILGLAYRF